MSTSHRPGHRWVGRRGDRFALAVPLTCLVCFSRFAHTWRTVPCVRVFELQSRHPWHRRFYDLNVWSEKKRREKLNDRHGNPVEPGMDTSPSQRPWSSFRFYLLGDDSVLPMDRLP